MNIVQWIADKRDGHRLSDSQIACIISGYTDGSIPDYQLAALAMAIFFRGMDRQEIVSLTRAMLNSGESFRWPELDQPVVCKHSTGGIGDKVSIILAPLLAAAGMAVPMISGRGLGATGGTLDKLESIPGFRVDWSMDQIRRQVHEIGVVIAGASQQIAPADRRLYALRDVTATVPSIPLITASILSKKLAAGLDALVLDVKFGSGAFMKSIDKARVLAESLIWVASHLGVDAAALLTDMNQPLGRMAGNANEINECIEVLQGQGPPDVRELAVELAATLVQQVTPDQSGDAARQRLNRLIDEGHAWDKFQQLVRAQGGTLSGPLPLASRRSLSARQSGWIARIENEQLGWAIIAMGGGRQKLRDPINHATGLEMLVRVGDQVDANQPLLNVYCKPADFPRIVQQLHDAIIISDEPAEPLPLVVERVEPETARDSH